MKVTALIALALTATCAHAQMEGFIHQMMEPVRRGGEAGAAAATGNLELGNMELGPRVAAPPSAKDVAAEIRRQEAEESALADQKHRQAIEQRVRAGISAQYKAEFGSR